MWNKMKTRVLVIIAVSSALVIPIGYFLWIEYGMVCNNAVRQHLEKYSNLFDENTTFETYAVHEVGTPFGVHSWNMQECVNHILEKRSLRGLEYES